MPFTAYPIHYSSRLVVDAGVGGAGLTLTLYQFDRLYTLICSNTARNILYYFCVWNIPTLCENIILVFRPHYSAVFG